MKSIGIFGGSSWPKRVIIKWMIGALAIIVACIVDGAAVSDRSIGATLERMSDNWMLAVSMTVSLVVSVLLFADMICFTMQRIKQITNE